MTIFNTTVFRHLFIVLGLITLTACTSGTSVTKPSGTLMERQISSEQAALEGQEITSPLSSKTALTAAQINSAQAALDAIETPESIF